MKSTINGIGRHWSPIIIIIIIILILLDLHPSPEIIVEALSPYSAKITIINENYNSLFLSEQKMIVRYREDPPVRLIGLFME